MCPEAASTPLPWRLVGDGVAVSVRLQPGSSRDAIDGVVALSDGSRSLKVRVRAQPEKGEANKALIKLLAKSLRLARGDFAVVAGAKDRNKTVRITGDGRQIIGLLRTTVAGTEDQSGDE